MLRGVVFAALAVLASGARPASAAPDSAEVRVDVGWRSDVSNESYYEQTFDDTTFRPARLQNSPEVVHSAVARLDWGQLVEGRRDSWRIGVDGRAGDLVRGVGVDGRFRRTDLSGWDLSVAPRVGWMADRTFDRDRSELRAATSVRGWRALAGGLSRWGVNGSSEVFRSSGSGSDLVLDRNVYSVGAAYERSSWSGAEVRIDLGIDARQFPDSVSRDHIEEHAEASARLDAGAGSLDGSVRVNRRGSTRVAATTRDRYWSGFASGEGRLISVRGWSGVARVEGEWQAYDQPDSSVYFDYQLFRAQAGPRFEVGAWSFELAPRAEWLRAPSNDAESYLEPALAAEIEWLGPGLLWTVAPACGRREYESPGSDPLGVHTSFDFLEAHLVVDQALPAHVRLRSFVYGRMERHADSTQDTRSLYFSVDVRRLF